MQPFALMIIAADSLARAGLQTLLADEPDCHVVGAVDGRDDWYELAEIYQPDVILFDMGWQNGAEPPDDLRELALPVVMLIPDEEAAQRAWTAGAQGVVARDGSAEQLLAALNAAYRGMVVFSAEYVPATLASAESEPDHALTEPITPREQEVLELLARGLTNRAIAHQLAISDHTVKFHVNALLTKFGAQSRTEAAVKATRLGLLSL